MCTTLASVVHMTNQGQALGEEAQRVTDVMLTATKSVVAKAVAAENDAHQEDAAKLLRGLTDLARAWEDAASDLSGQAASRCRARSESFRQAHRLTTAYLKADPAWAESVLHDLLPDVRLAR